MKARALLAATVLLTAGCADLTTTGVPADGPTSAGATAAGAAADARAPLDGTSWKLAEGAGMDAAAHPATARFSEGTISGSAPVNSFTATYEVEGDALAIGPVASTKKAGEPEAMAAEDAFFESLGTVERYALVGDELQLIADDEPVLTFARQDAEAGSEAEQLAATLVGMPADEARAAVEDADLAYRVVAEDGSGKAVTSDNRADRINVELEDGVVTKATVG